MLARASPFALLLGLIAIAMLLPTAVALSERDWLSARSFLYAGIFTGFAAAILGVALSGPLRAVSARAELIQLLLAWSLVPLFAAAPLILITPELGYVGAYFEMLLCFTTTGGTAYADLARVADAIHLWRGIVGWCGGLLSLAAAYVIFAPRRLGGFEVYYSSGARTGELGSQLVALGAATPAFSARLGRALRFILPVYLGLAMLLALLLSGLGSSALAATIHAMSVISTSGISPYPGGIAAEESFGLELVAAVFLVATATRLVYSNASQAGSRGPWHHDPELGLLLSLVVLATATLFLRHWLGALTIDLGETAEDSAGALWGAAFTTLSFLTTTGFQSSYWDSARDWSGLANPGLVLLGLCAIGGGAATAAGGVKLIRLYALIRHGLRELDRLSQPSAVVGVGSGMRGILREGAFIAWAFVMLYILAVMTVMLALAFSGMTFTEGFVGAVAMISNTGQAFTLVLEGERTLATTSTDERLIMGAAMILGRIETLGLIALFNPDSWPLYGKGGGRAGNGVTSIHTPGYESHIGMDLGHTTRTNKK